MPRKKLPKPKKKYASVDSRTDDPAREYYLAAGYTEREFEEINASARRRVSESPAQRATRRGRSFVWTIEQEIDFYRDMRELTNKGVSVSEAARTLAKRPKWAAFAKASGIARPAQTFRERFVRMEATAAQVLEHVPTPPPGGPDDQITGEIRIVLRKKSPPRGRK